MISPDNITRGYDSLSCRVATLPDLQIHDIDFFQRVASERSCTLSNMQLRTMQSALNPGYFEALAEARGSMCAAFVSRIVVTNSTISAQTRHDFVPRAAQTIVCLRLLGLGRASALAFGIEPSRLHVPADCLIVEERLVLRILHRIHLISMRGANDIGRCPEHRPVHVWYLPGP